jgi:hypothetical protein
MQKGVLQDVLDEFDDLDDNAKEAIYRHLDKWWGPEVKGD